MWQIRVRLALISMSFKGQLSQDHIKGAVCLGVRLPCYQTEITENSVCIVFMRVVTQAEPHRKRYINTPGVEFRQNITLTRRLL